MGNYYMSRTFYHKGLTVELDSSVPQLTVEGRKVPNSSSKGKERYPWTSGSAYIMAKNNIDAVMSETTADSQSDLPIQVERLEPSFLRWQRTTREVFIQLLGKAPTIAMDIDRTGQPIKDMLIWIASLHDQEHTLLSTRK